jgi:hypothetical protein
MDRGAEAEVDAGRVDPHPARPRAAATQITEMRWTT